MYEGSEEELITWDSARCKGLQDGHPLIYWAHPFRIREKSRWPIGDVMVELARHSRVEGNVCCRVFKRIYIESIAIIWKTREVQRFGEDLDGLPPK